MPDNATCRGALDRWGGHPSAISDVFGLPDTFATFLDWRTFILTRFYGREGAYAMTHKSASPPQLHNAVTRMRAAGR